MLRREVAVSERRRGRTGRRLVVAVLSDNSRDSGLTPAEVGARVTAILSAAQREAVEIIEAARREALGAERAAAGDEGVASANGLLAVVRALESLSSRLGAFERAVDARLEVLWRAVSPPAPASSDAGAPRPTPGDGAVVARAERLRAVDLALRGFSRAQIAAELRATLADAQIEQLLEDVLENA